MTKLEKNNIIQSLVITSDPQYPWTPRMDNNDNGESEAETKRISENLIREQYQNINSYTNSVSNASIIINGDITSYGHSWQWIKMTDELLPILNRPFYFGLGNHDIENNQGDCFQDSCFSKSMVNLRAHINNMGLSSFQVDIDKYHKNGSFGYAVDFGDVYSLQLNNYPTMKYFSLHSGFELKENMNWIEQNLK
ncbi:metallophosphoesterase [Bacillus mycoides]|uniref:metallophosphoesterase n=1 Tax=Bacillus mycoides TaxID=1405 RepID=UPI003D646907